ncbi:TIGR03862 family flavoprotein [Undibacterium arcticum]|uniref:TIGR03862 family flavoprotein n=1 Tax=Undibacterium arcticum TaxID=1762892 RepID=A0ABV7FCK2_9BURK
MTPISQTVAIIGGGPAGLMAAEVLSQHGLRVDLYDAMPSVGRKFLLAGRGGMNLTHSEPLAPFLARYGARAQQVAPWLDGFGPDALRAWVHGLGIDTFVGSSGRVFPTDMKAAPLLRAWLHRLRAAGVGFHMRHRWLGWQDDDTQRDSERDSERDSQRGSNHGSDRGARALRFMTPHGEQTRQADAVVLALGGGSWARLGSDGAWVPLLAQQGVAVAPLQPANCGFEVGHAQQAGWSEHFRSRYAGQPVKSVALHYTDPNGQRQRRSGELMVSDRGVEGSLIYAISSVLREQINAAGAALIALDLAPDWPLQRVIDALARPRGARSMASHLQSRVNITGVKAGLLRELASAADYADPELLAHKIKALPLRLTAARPLDEAISSAGGVRFDALDAQLMLSALPGVFCAGEMLDWEAPTGGYLLTACFASGRAAAHGVLAWLAGKEQGGCATPRILDLGQTDD